MSTLAKLAGFAAVLALAFGAAALAGSRADVHPGRPAAKPAMAGMGAAVAPEPVRGLAVSDAGLTLELARTTAPQGRPFALRFRIAGSDGRAVRAFDLEHTKRMHLVVVRRDLTGFQHLHPAMAPDGTWTTSLTLPDAGAYRVFADFGLDGRPRTLAADFTVDGDMRTVPLPAPARTAEVDGLRVALTEGATRAGRESSLAFSVTRDGRPVAVEDYLGAKGHLVALRRGDLAFLHVHPDAARLRFMAAFPTAGQYRLFLQFKTEGRVHTAAFTQEVTR